MAEDNDARGWVTSAERLRGKVSEKRAETERMNKELNEMKAKLKERESECTRIREENKQAFEVYAQIQLCVDSMVLPFLYGTNGGGA